MTLPLVVLRPEPGLQRTVVAAEDLGLTVIAASLFAILPVPWRAPDPVGFDAIIAGSANAFRCGGPELARLTTLPVLAVGEHTAQAAREAGFAVSAIGEGGLQQLLQTRGSPERLLRLAGEEHVALTPPADIVVEQRIVYRTVPGELPGAAIEALRRGAVALLHSAGAAALLARECDRLKLDRGRISLAALGPRIAAAAGSGWRTVAAADRPTDAGLLAMAAAMCNDGPDRGD